MEELLSNPTFIELVVFLAVACSMIGLGIWQSQRQQQIDSRVRELVANAKRSPTQSNAGSQLARERFESLLLGSKKHKDSVQSRLVEAGIYGPTALTIYLAVRLSLAIALPSAILAAAQFGSLRWHYAWIATVPAALVGLYLPHVRLERQRARRHLLLRRALPDFLDLVTACLAGGQSVQAALYQVTDELKLAHSELAVELMVMLREIELGSSLDFALQQLASRTGLDELRTLRSFVQQTGKLGTTITDAMEQMADMLRTQRGQRAEEMAQKAAVKILFPTLLFIFPTVFVVLAGPAAIQIKDSLANSSYESSALSTE